MSAHTPGPWTLKPNARGGRAYWHERGQIQNEDGESVAFVPADDTREIENGIIAEILSPTAVATARLISAAPDLLAGYSMRCANCGCRPIIESAASGCPECAGARAAIAKARGGK